MIKYTSFILIFFSSLTLNSDTLHHWSATPEEIKNFYRQCGKLPSVAQMEKELRESIRRKEEERKEWKGRGVGQFIEKVKESFNMGSEIENAGKNLFDYLKDFSNPKNTQRAGEVKVEFVDIDGFKIQKISFVELEMLLHLTDHLENKNILLMHINMKFKEQIKDGVLYIKRICKRKLCAILAKRDLGYIYNLHSFNDQDSVRKEGWGEVLH